MTFTATKQPVQNLNFLVGFHGSINGCFLYEPCHEKTNLRLHSRKIGKTVTGDRWMPENGANIYSEIIGVLYEDAFR